MTERLERAFASLARLRAATTGHFLNWYALPDLSVLEPAYVSTVDSGNLAGHLIALRQACLALRRGGAPRHDAGDDALAAAPGTDRRHSAIAMCARWTSASSTTGPTKLFRIGFNASTHQLDQSSYDLLASEARLASFVAIAKDEVPTEHWFHLGRTLTMAHGHAALVSWSGSMFEYLMPILVMRAFPATLLGHTYDGALQRQIRHGAEHGVPWGVSESAYNVRDRHLTYQYRAFGVPDLALKRGLGLDLVIAPYASGLALMLDPAQGAREPRGARGDGRVRAVRLLRCARLDASRRRWRSPALVRCHMAHHVGMTLVALTNVLRERVLAGTLPRRPDDLRGRRSCSTSACRAGWSSRSRSR